MGEIADAMINGLFCGQCGEVFGDLEEPGYPRFCPSCEKDQKDEAPPPTKAELDRRSREIDAQKREARRRSNRERKRRRSERNARMARQHFEMLKLLTEIGKQHRDGPSKEDLFELRLRARSMAREFKEENRE